MVNINQLVEKKVLLEEWLKDDTAQTFYLIFIPSQTSWERAHVPYNYMFFIIYFYKKTVIV